jgi:hypothetical protein
MGQLLAFPTPAPKDGGKARILRRRDGLFGMSPIEQARDAISEADRMLALFSRRDDLTMHRAGARKIRRQRNTARHHSTARKQGTST